MTKQGEAEKKRGGGGGKFSNSKNKVEKNKNQSKNNNNFPEYMEPINVLRGLRDGELVEGVLRINPKSYEDAFIPSPGARDQDIHIKGIRARNRALNGDVVIVDVDSPEKWNVNHAVIQDFVDMKASEEDKNILMAKCIVNVKEEKEQSKSVETSRDDDTVVTATDDSVDVKTATDESDKIVTDESVDDKDLTSLIQQSADPLSKVPEADDASDYESDKNSIIDVDSDDSGDDVVVETTVDDTNTSLETALDTSAELYVDAVDSSTDTQTKKSKRRGRRGGKKQKLKDDNKVKTSSASSFKRQPNSRPLVEYNILSVLKHPDWQERGFVQKTGRVVSIKEYKHSRLAAGYIKTMADGNKNFFLFSPTDSRFPRLKIPSQQLAQNQLYEGYLFLASIEKWDRVNMGLGKLQKSLGLNTDIGVRSEALLLENNIDYAEFPDTVLADLPQDYDHWRVSEKEVSRRRDFRSECVFTIDPATARDLDDALSVRRLDSGLYRIGVHIADVSHFVRSGTSLDRAALDRATSTYLVDRVVPMLPRPLCEKLCSLNPHEDRLTFSVEWTMNDDAEILSEWFGRSVICSACKLSYEDAQTLIDTDDHDLSVPVAAPHTLETISSSVRIMNKIAVLLRSRREERGALRLDQPKLCFTLNKETGLPDGFKIHEHRASNKMIEEFMLLANMAVARKIFAEFPMVATLRRHPDPKIDVLDKLVEQLAFLGVEINGLSSQDLSRSLDKIKMEEDAEKLACVTNLLSKPMNLARYFCTGMYEYHNYHHYALNVPLYTHFTSPIRRYPDILVHRLLDLALRGVASTWDPAEVEKAASHCNDKRLAAKTVSEASSELFLALFISNCGPLTRPGVVTGVMDHSVDVLILELGVVKRVYVDRCGVQRHVFKRTVGVSNLDLIWEDGVRLNLKVLTKVSIVLSKGDKDFDFIAVIEKPEKVEKDEDMITID